MLGSLKKKFRPEKGQVVVFTVLLLPLILGVVVFVIEIGNIYVHYSDLQTIADTAALTRDPTKAKAVVDANSKNLNNKDEFKITITTCKGIHKNSGEKVFYVKLEKDMPPFFLKVFDKMPTLKAGAAVRDDGTPMDPLELENVEW